MATTPVARRYARALLELGQERNILDKLSAQIQSLSDLYDGSRELRNVLLNPSVKLEERRNIVRALAERSGWEPIFRNFVLFVLDKDRIGHIGGMAEELQRLVDDARGEVRARVTSASPLEAAQREAVKQAIARMTGKSVLLEADTDEDLLGGVVTRVGGTVYDGSVRTQLNRMREAILKEV